MEVSKTTTTSEAKCLVLHFEEEKEAKEFITSQNTLTKLCSNVFASTCDKLTALMDVQNKIHRPLTGSNSPQAASSFTLACEQSRKELLCRIPCSIEKLTVFSSPQMFDAWGQFRSHLCQSIDPFYVSVNLTLIRDVFDFLQNSTTITPGCIEREFFDELKNGLEHHERLLLAPGVSKLHHLYEAEELGVLDKVVHQLPLEEIPKVMLFRYLCTLGAERERWLDSPLSTQDGVIPRRDTLSFEQFYVLHLFCVDSKIRRSRCE